MDEISYEILALVKKKMVEQGAFDRESYLALVDETIDYFLEKGKIDQDENDEFIKKQLAEQWPEVESEFSQEI